jgi:hypothetical protein
MTNKGTGASNASGLEVSVYFAAVSLFDCRCQMALASQLHIERLSKIQLQGSDTVIASAKIISLLHFL